jgi:hypothetical protein
MFVGKREEPIMLIVLTIVTCSIYHLIWELRITKEINSVAGREVLPSWVPIVSFFVAPVGMYFVDKALQEVMPMRGLQHESKFIIWLLLCLVGFGLILYLFQAQTALNQMWDAGGAAPQ